MITRIVTRLDSALIPAGDRLSCPHGETCARDSGASIDHGPSADFIAHQILNGANIYALENVANIGALPATGATLIALPMKIGEGTGAPARIIAILP